MSSKKKFTISITDSFCDEKLIELIQTPDLSEETKQKAFSILYERYHRQICKFANSRIPGSGHDILMGTMVVMIEKLKTRKYIWKGIPFEAWLIEIAKNKLREYYSEHAKHKVLSIDSVSPLILPEMVNEDLYSDESGIYQWLKVVDLSDYQCELVIQKLRGRSFKDIAADLGKTYAGVRVAHSRAIRKIRQNSNVLLEFYNDAKEK